MSHSEIEMIATFLEANHNAHQKWKYFKIGTIILFMKLAPISKGVSVAMSYQKTGDGVYIPYAWRKGTITAQSTAAGVCIHIPWGGFTKPLNQ